MIDRVRQRIRQHIHAEFLGEFEALCEVTGDLWDKLNAETGPVKARALALAWSMSALSLAKTEYELLAEILPDMEQELDAFSSEIQDLNKRTEEAQGLMDDLHGGDVPQPQTIDRDARIKEHRERKATKLIMLRQISNEAQAITANQAPLLAAIGGVKLSVRTLKVYIDTHFSVAKPMSRFAPGMDLRETSGKSESDPHKRFADQWVAAMDPENRVEANRIRKFRDRQTKMRLRPRHDFDKDKEDRVAEVAARS